MKWTLFLDDERHPVRHDRDVWIARTSLEAIDLIKEKGCPTIMLLDHDLGYGDDVTSIFYPRFVALILDGEVRFPEGFKCHVHSMNPVGAENLRSKIACLHREMLSRH